MFFADIDTRRLTFQKPILSQNGKKRTMPMRISYNRQRHVGDFLTLRQQQGITFYVTPGKTIHSHYFDQCTFHYTDILSGHGDTSFSEPFGTPGKNRTLACRYHGIPLFGHDHIQRRCFMKTTLFVERERNPRRCVDGPRKITQAFPLSIQRFRQKKKNHVVRQLDVEEILPNERKGILEFRCRQKANSRFFHTSKRQNLTFLHFKKFRSGMDIAKNDFIDRKTFYIFFRKRRHGHGTIHGFQSRASSVFQHFRQRFENLEMIFMAFQLYTFGEIT
ncbi:hypothetical protein [Hydrogenimonas sp.]